MSLTDLPTLNAFLNATAAVLLTAGYLQIRAGHIQTHKKLMISAFTVSVLFLVSYLVYHSQVGSVPYQKTGPIRTVYFAILISHSILAALVPFLAIVTLRRGLKNRIPKHRQIARWTLPIWLYVSVTGVVVYLMLYRL